MFVVATLVGRAARFMTVAYLIHRFGSPIQKFIERNFNLLTIVFSVLLVGGFVLLPGGGEEERIFLAPDRAHGEGERGCVELLDI